MTTAVIRSFLGARVSAYEGTTAEFAPVLVVTTPEGQRHELGALMSALIAAAKGWQPLYLGPSTPTDEIAFAAVHTAARAVALSIGYPADDPRLPSALQTLRQQLPTEVALLAGGASVQHYQAALRAIGAVCPKDLQDLQTELDRLRQPQQQALSS
jgi:methylmalonyl-CoA mutase cobalamin-binding subunit